MKGKGEKEQSLQGLHFVIEIQGTSWFDRKFASELAARPQICQETLKNISHDEGGK